MMGSGVVVVVVAVVAFEGVGPASHRAGVTGTVDRAVL